VDRGLRWPGSARKSRRGSGRSWDGPHVRADRQATSRGCAAARPEVTERPAGTHNGTCREHIMDGTGTENRNVPVHIDTETRARTHDHRLQPIVYACDCDQRTMQFPLMRTSRTFRYFRPNNR
jgi:hypothetical protein